MYLRAPTQDFLCFCQCAFWHSGGQYAVVDRGLKLQPGGKAGLCFRCRAAAKWGSRHLTGLAGPLELHCSWERRIKREGRIYIMHFSSKGVVNARIQVSPDQPREKGGEGTRHMKTGKRPRYPKPNHHHHSQRKKKRRSSAAKRNQAMAGSPTCNKETKKGGVQSAFITRGSVSVAVSGASRTLPQRFVATTIPLKPSPCRS